MVARLKFCPKVTVKNNNIKGELRSLKWEIEPGVIYKLGSQAPLYFCLCFPSVILVTPTLSVCKLRLVCPLVLVTAVIHDGISLGHLRPKLSRERGGWREKE